MSSKEETQVCGKCEKTLPISKFQETANGKSHYKNCKDCVKTRPSSATEEDEVEETKTKPKAKASAPAEKSKEEKPKAKPKAKAAAKKPETDKKVLLLLSNFDSAYAGLRSAHVEEEPEKIGQAFTEFMKIHTQLQALAIED
jgi:hypothetical protein